VNEKVKVRMTRNEATRLDAYREENCPWMIKASKDNIIEAIVARQYCKEHTCEKYWELNQKIDLAAFAIKVQRKFKGERDEETLHICFYL
jgi:hypothetical protein